MVKRKYGHTKEIVFDIVKSTIIKVIEYAQSNQTQKRRILNTIEYGRSENHQNINFLLREFNPMAINYERLAATMNGDFVVFLIGMRINSMWKIHKWMPVAKAMPKMIRELYQKKEYGFLGGDFEL